MKSKLISAIQAAHLINDEVTVCIGGAGAGHNIPDKVLQAIGERFQKEGHPQNITTVHPCGIGDNAERGLNHLAHTGLVAEDIGGFWGNSPKLIDLAKAEKLKGYNFPQGVLAHLMRAQAGREGGVLTRTGLHTFVDPRYEGGKINKSTTRDRVEVVTIGGEEHLYYHAQPVDVALIRGSSIDCEGNLTMEEEVGTFSMLSIAQAAKVNGGIVIAQVKYFHPEKHAIPVQVKVPGILIDYVVEAPDQTMTFVTDYEEALINRTARYEKEQLSLEGIKKVIARRAAMELRPADKVNLGYGMADGVPIVAQQAGKLDKITFMIEQGQIDGVITTGLNFGAMYNPAAILDDGYQFDHFHGGILDICFLGFAQVDRFGNVNASRFGNILTGCGGFIDISQHTGRVVFCGSFAAKSQVEVHEEGFPVIWDPGKYKKFIRDVEQITFNGRLALEKAGEVLYVTERAVFELTNDGLLLREIAPNIDQQKDVLDMMEFEPIVPEDVKVMDKALFNNGAFSILESEEGGG